MKQRITDFDLNGKRVIIRCDLNVPIVNDYIYDDTRIKKSLRTIQYAISKNSKVILLSHLGRIKCKEDMALNSLYVVSLRLSRYLSRKVYFSPETRGKKLEEMVSNLKCGDVLLVENTRFEDLEDNKESNCSLELSKYWAHLGDIFINDAYGVCHRNHASVTGIPKYLPSGIGFLVNKELQKIDGIIESKARPYIVVMGGKKVIDKIVMIKNLIKTCDYLLIGGAMSFTFLKSLGYDVGLSIVSEKDLDFAKEMLEKYKDKIVLPVDFVTESGVKNIDNFEKDDIGFDIGPKTIKRFEHLLEDAKRVIINGPMGMYEQKKYSKGTRCILKCLDKNKVKTLVGGGDTASCCNKLGYQDAFYHISTGGGATIKYLEDRKLIGIEVIDDYEEKDK